MTDRDKILKRFLIPKLRRYSLYWVARTECKREARIERGLYRCNACKKGFSGGEVQVDHKNPIVNVKLSWQGWDHYINSLFCSIDNLQVLCKPCHLSKTQIEDSLRVINQKKKKNANNKNKK